jgi:hypothetical protein
MDFIMVANDVYVIIHHIFDLYENFVQEYLIRDELVLV